jgi:hypothetical protein
LRARQLRENNLSLPFTFDADIVEAIKEIASISGTFKANLIAWLASASNGLHDLYASIIHSQEDHTKNSASAPPV